MTRIHLIGVPLDLGAGRRGPDMGPSALRLTRLQKRLTELGHEVEDLGNVLVQIPKSIFVADPSMRYAEAIAAVCVDLAEHTRAAIVAEADSDGDGKIDFEEFVRMMKEEKPIS